MDGATAPPEKNANAHNIRQRPQIPGIQGSEAGQDSCGCMPHRRKGTGSAAPEWTVQEGYSRMYFRMNSTVRMYIRTLMRLALPMARLRMVQEMMPRQMPSEML